MELARRLSQWTRLSEPGAGSFAFQAVLGALLTFLFWVSDAVTDYFIFGGSSFYHFLLEPDPHEIADFSLVLFLVCCLLLYSRRAHRVQAKLEAALQEALQKAEGERAKLVGIVEAMGDAISIQDPQMTVLYQNRAHLELMGSHVGSYCYEAYRHQKSVCPDCHLMESFQDGKVRRVELNLPCTKSDNCLEISGSVLKGPGGEMVVGIQVVRDITARKLAEMETASLNASLTRQAVELHQANRELEAFCQAISHDLRAPLTRVYSSAQELQGYQHLVDDNGRFFINLVNDGCVQMEAMLDALMVLCRVTEVEIVPTEVDLSLLVQELAALLQQDEPARRVSWQTLPSLVVQGDPALLRIALDNLVANAWKYTAGVAEPVIELGSFFSEEGELVVFLRDNGAGFDSTRSNELFKPFRRLHTTREFPGTGLGLATVRRIVRRHNGRVWGEGTPGRGATFYFTING